MGIIPRGSSHDSLEQDLLPVPRYSSRTPTSTFPRTSWARSLRALQALPDYNLQRGQQIPGVSWSREAAPRPEKSCRRFSQSVVVLRRSGAMPEPAPVSQHSLLSRSTLRNDALLCCKTQSHLKY
ncbi:hypothetical protein DV515_00015619 [Chloebia gouldiae]|uniref:Uncharacterized protein n=1 Tax=Chloebia gouldiae TaxID=44316 RepID=A0A3L8RUY4_CHLGU|nr:hypothetical protein DV515_00015619 [Chloebia gouldiae]